MKVGSLVQIKPSRHQLHNEPYVGKVGIVVEQNAPCDEYDKDVVEMWWVQWQGNSDWDIEWQGDLEVLS
tara:strand:- start:158 stop:364 length:207 start_codon:yes stop_codon:yes gene_type:complete